MNSELEKIPGQKRVKQTLTNFIQSKLIPHALLFTGNDGVGKDNAAILFAKELVTSGNGEEKQKAGRFIEMLQEPYIKLIFPLPRGKNEMDSSTPTEKLTVDELEVIHEEIQLKAANPFHKISIPKATSIKINSIRDIKKFLSMEFKEIGYRFILITDAHLMNEESQNALLKNLEEPPEKVIFILTTPLPSKLRPTILSRCWRINFDPLSEEEIIFVLSKYYNVDRATAAEVAPFAMGSVQSALNLIDIDVHNLKEKTISILRYSFGKKFNSAFNELNSLLSEQKASNLPVVINMIISWINDLQKHRLDLEGYYYKDHPETLEKFNTRFPDADLYELTSRLDRLSILPGNNINPSLLSASLIFELTSVVLTRQ
jgi:DNA polymerase-3 subunit delta'